MKEVTKDEFLVMQENGDNIMIDVWAEWCGPCKILKPMLNDLEVPNNVKLVALNFEENNEFVRTLNVRSLPTVLFFKGKTEIKRLIGLNQIDEYKKEILKLSEL